MSNEDEMKNDNNCIISKTKNIYNLNDNKKNKIKKKDNDNPFEEGISRKRNIFKNHISIKNIQDLSISASKDDNSKKEMYLSINKFKNKRKNKSKINSIDSHDISLNYSINSKNNDVKEQNKKEKLTCRQRLTRFLETNNKYFYIKLILYLLSFLSFIYYVICTYINSLYESLNYIDYFICMLYIIEHLINIILSHHFLTYIISIDSLISFLVEIPPFLVFLCENYTIDLLYRTINMTRVLRLLKAYKIVELIQGNERNVYGQIIYIIITLIIMILIWAGIIQMSDLGEVTRRLTITYETFIRHNLLLRKDFHHYIYFSLESLTTVGYGEIIPFTILSKLMIVLMVIIILVVVPEQTNEIINLSNSQTIYERRNYISTPDIPFVVILGDIDLETLKVFSKEFFHKEHGDIYRHIVILMNKNPNEKFEHFLNQKNNSKFIIYLQGDPMNKEDLLRASILNAKSCIIFINKNSLDQYNGDHQALLLAIYIKKLYYHTILENHIKDNKLDLSKSLSIKNNLKFKINNIFKKKNNFRICLQINKPESCNFYYSTLQKNYQRNMISDKILVIESLKINLLSKSCITPGIISLISNLVISSSVREKYISEKEPTWLKEYKEGQQYEIYKYKNIHGDLLFYNYQKLTQEIYNQFHSILIALEINYKGGTLVKLNPQSKEKLIDILYYSLFLDSKNNTSEDINNKEEQSNETIIEEFHKEYENEIEENNRKLNSIDFKKVRISLYCISSDKNIINNIKKLDEKIAYSQIMKKNTYYNNNILFLNNNNFKYTQKHQNLNKDIQNRKFSFNPQYKNKVNFNLQSSKILSYQNCSSDYDSDFSDDEGNEFGKIINEKENNNYFDEEDLNKNYYLIDESNHNYIFSNEITRQRINDSNDIKNHIVICGMHQELMNFILPLRNKYLPEKLLKWIVILSPFLPQEMHETLCKFPKIIYIKGNPLIPENLSRANISSADIAVILSNSNFTYNISKSENEYNDYNDYDDLNDLYNLNEYLEVNKNDKNFNNNLNTYEEAIDSKTIFIYKSIKNLNKSIQIIVELLLTNDIEFLLSSYNLKKLYKYSKQNKEIIENNMPHINDGKDDEDNNKENLLYELTPIFASGEVYIPSLIDKIMAQIFYNSNILTILNLLLIGEKKPEKNPDKKLAEMIDIEGTNIFLIPSEPRNESFGDMFNRLLYKYNMISIALYRKNVSQKFYYVYINPKETTLIRDTDMIFVLSSTENIKNIYEKNFGENPFSKYDQKQSPDNNNVYQSLMKGVIEQINNNNEIKENNYNNYNNINKDNSENNKETNENNDKKDNNKKEVNSNEDDSNKKTVINVYKKNKKKKTYIHLNLKESHKEKNNNIKDIKDNPQKKGKFIEIDKIQNKIDKGIKFLTKINDKNKDIKNNVETIVKQEISNEMLFYISNYYKQK